MSKSEDIRAVAPALENYAHKVIQGDLWKRPGLSPGTGASSLSRRSSRADRRTAVHLGLALDNVVKPAEISEIITQLSFYNAWADANR